MVMCPQALYVIYQRCANPLCFSPLTFFKESSSWHFKQPAFRLSAKTTGSTIRRPDITSLIGKVLASSEVVASPRELRERRAASNARARFTCPFDAKRCFFLAESLRTVSTGNSKPQLLHSRFLLRRRWVWHWTSFLAGRHFYFHSNQCNPARAWPCMASRRSYARATFIAHHQVFRKFTAHAH